MLVGSGGGGFLAAGRREGGGAHGLSGFARGLQSCGALEACNLRVDASGFQAGRRRDARCLTVQPRRFRMQVGITARGVRGCSGNGDGGGARAFPRRGSRSRWRGGGASGRLCILITGLAALVQQTFRAIVVVCLHEHAPPSVGLQIHIRRGIYICQEIYV